MKDNAKITVSKSFMKITDENYLAELGELRLKTTNNKLSKKAKIHMSREFSRLVGDLYLEDYTKEKIQD